MTEGNAVPAVRDLVSAGPVHVIGIGGAGMSGIARILLAQGARVSGSDAKDSRRLAALRALGATVFVGHDAAQLGDTATVIISTAIKDTNPELAGARKRGIPVISRAVALASLMSGFTGVAVAGTHGKTTTTSMLTVALQHCGADPSFAIGSELSESGSNAHLGSGDLFVAEADESDGSFLLLGARVGIVTNVEPDHLDYWGSFEAVTAAFGEFALGLRDHGGFLVACLDDPGASALAESAAAQGVDVRAYGTAPGADLRVRLLSGEGGARAGGWTFDVSCRGIRSRAVTLRVPGRHNVLNAAAALACGMGLGYPEAELIAGLESFAGTRRRFEFRGQVGGIRVYDDYAHHPTEIAATLRAAREVAGAGQLVVAFQAHHYYRTALFAREFGEALGLADQVVVLEVFAPGEEPIPGASGQMMAASVPLPPDQVVFEPSWSRVPQHLAARARSGDVIMTLGAGDISMLGPEVLDLLRRQQIGTPS